MAQALPSLLPPAPSQPPALTALHTSPFWSLCSLCLCDRAFAYFFYAWTPPQQLRFYSGAYWETAPKSEQARSIYMYIFWSGNTSCKYALKDYCQSQRTDFSGTFYIQQLGTPLLTAGVFSRKLRSRMPKYPNKQKQKNKNNKNKEQFSQINDYSISFVREDATIRVH